MFDKAFENAQAAAERVTFPVRLAEKDAIQAQFSSPSRINPFEVSLAEKVDFLSEMDASNWTKTASSNASAILNFMRKQIVFLDSEGSQVEKLITEVFATPGRGRIGCAGQRPRTQLHRTHVAATARGWESIDRQIISASTPNGSSRS